MVGCLLGQMLLMQSVTLY